MSSNDNANMMNLCRVLVGTGAESDKARAQCAIPADRVTLFASYGIPAAKQGDAGYFLAHYEQDDNFNLAIQAMLSMAAQILTNQALDGAAVREQLDDWEQTAIFDFLYQLTQDPALYQQLHALFPGGSATAQQAFMQQNLPEDHYAEREAIAALVGAQQDKELATSVGTIMTTFEARYQFLC
jgi:hypothetical protein